MRYEGAEGTLAIEALGGGDADVVKLTLSSTGGMPIALMGAPGRFGADEVAVHSFVDGLLTEIALEVMPGESK